MTYCLMTEDRKIRVEIRCSATNRPKNLAYLVAGVNDDKIIMIKPNKITKKIMAAYLITELETDWERTGTNLRLINWIATENL